jgi:hypothetical protein
VRRKIWKRKKERRKDVERGEHRKFPFENEMESVDKERKRRKREDRTFSIGKTRRSRRKRKERIDRLCSARDWE